MKSLAAVISALVLAAPGSAALAQPASGCDSAQSHQFDFWVGRWSVSPAGHLDRHVADSLIEKLYLGCAVRENWMPLRGDAGGSLSSYVAGEGLWKQTWIDATGARVDFKGGWNGKAMVLTGTWPQPGHPTQLTRMTYSAQPDGSVRQLGESSDDAGRSWQPSFDFIYRKAPA
jgi:hypothetical protein